MLQNIIKFSIQNRFIVLAITGLLVIAGLFSLKNLPVDAIPDITDNQVQVITTSYSLATQEMEKYVTYPLELALQNIPGVENLRSVSRYGLSVITVIFEDAVNVYLARQLVNERIGQVIPSLPNTAETPYLAPISTGLGEIYQYVIYPAAGFESAYGLADLRDIQDWHIKRQLAGTKGVIEVNSSGGYLRQMEVMIDPHKLQAYGVTLQEVHQAIANSNANIGGSYIEAGANIYFIRSEGIYHNTYEVEQTVITRHNQQVILLKDVATISWGYTPRLGAVTMNGKGEVVAGQVMMLKGENSAAVTELVKEKIEEVKNTLPAGIILEPYLDRTKLVDQTIRTARNNLLEGGLIVVFVLILILGNLRAGLIVASVIPLSMLFALILMYYNGVSASLMSLGAIDFGIIVDGAVIIVEAILFRLQHQDFKQSIPSIKEKVVEESARSMLKSAIFGELIILMVYIPIFFLSGIEGKMFKPMAHTVSYAILGALILSMTYVPAMSSLLLTRGKIGHFKFADQLTTFFYSAYRPVFRLAMKFKAILIILVIVILGFTIALFKSLGGEFIPTLEEGDLALHQILPPGSSIQQSVKVSSALQDMLMNNFPEIEKIVTKIGTAEIPTDIMPMEAGDIYVVMKPKEEWVSATNREAMFKKIEEVVNGYPGIIYEFTQPIQMRFNELMTGVRQDIAIKIFGENISVLYEQAQKLKIIVSSIPGAGTVTVENISGLQQIVIRYNRAKMAQYGVTIDEVNEIIKTNFAGSVSGTFYEGDRRYDIAVRLDEAYRKDRNALENLQFLDAQGNIILLRDLAEIALEEGPTQISRENTRRRITIGVNALNRDVESLVKAIATAVERDLPLPSGYQVIYGGQFENLRKAQARLAISVPAALAIILILLYFAFGSFQQTLLIATALPLSAIGGVWALVLRGMPFSISAGIGFITLFGVAVLNGIVLISELKNLKSQGVINLDERIDRATQVRFRPVMLTAMVAALGFLPMALSTTNGAEVQKPLATVVIGGLVTSTLLTLIVLPILYYWSEKYLNAGAKYLSTIGLVLGISSTAVSQATTTKPIVPTDLIAIISQSQANHPKLMSLENQRLARQSELNYHPNLQLNLMAENEEYRFGPYGIWTLNGGIYLPNPSKNRATNQVRQANYNTANLTLRINVLQLAKELSLRYQESLFIREKITVLKGLEALWLQAAELEERKVLSGQGSVIQQAMTSQNLALIRTDIQTAMQLDEQLLLLLNQWNKSDTLWRPGEQNLAPPSPTQLDIENLDKHPQVLLEKENQQRIAGFLALNKANYKPDYSLTLRHQIVDGHWPFWGVQAGLTYPLSRQNLKTTENMLHFDQLSAQQSLDFADQSLQSQRNTLIITRGSLINQYNTINDLVDKAELMVQSASRQYELGGLPFPQWFEAARSYSQLKLQRLDILWAYHQNEIDLHYLFN